MKSFCLLSSDPLSENFRQNNVDPVSKGQDGSTALSPLGQ